MYSLQLLYGLFRLNLNKDREKERPFLACAKNSIFVFHYSKRRFLKYIYAETTLMHGGGNFRILCEKKRDRTTRTVEF